MNILLITHFFPPTHTAGTEKRTFGYAKTLLEHGHSVQVLCVGSWGKGRRYWNEHSDEIHQNIPVRRIHLNWKLAPDPNRYLYNNPVVEQHLKKWLVEWKPDVVHITSCLTLSASVINAVNAGKIPIVLTLTDYWFICPRINLVRQDGSLCDGRTTPWDCLEDMFEYSKIYRGITHLFPAGTARSLLTAISRNPLITRMRGFRGKMRDMEDRKKFLGSMLEKVTIMTAPSNSLSNTIRRSGVMFPIKVVHSGHDLSWLESNLVRTGSEKIRLGYIGQIIPLKGVDVLVSAFVKKDIYENMHLAIYGARHKNPEYMRTLLAIIQQEADAPIEFRGEFPHEQLGAVLSEIDVLVIPSLWTENNPRVIQEAFAAKVPVIASDVEGISEFVENEVNGLLFERGNIDDLGRKLQRIYHEPGLLNQLQSGIPPVKVIEDEVLEYEEIYKTLIDHDNLTDARNRFAGR